MKTLIICESSHHGNTQKIALAMAGILAAEIKRPGEITAESLDGYGLVGFGSGIYFGRHDKPLFELLSHLPMQGGKKAFIFSTSGMGVCRGNRALKNDLKWKGFAMVGEFCCKGFDTFGPFRFIGGIAKGHPNEKDIQNATAFAKTLLNA